jgi:hypothetical protein
MVFGLDDGFGDYDKSSGLMVNNSILYQKSQVYVGNVLREVPGYSRWLSAVAGYSPFP